jgi:hypothetical protein
MKRHFPKAFFAITLAAALTLPCGPVAAKPSWDHAFEGKPYVQVRRALIRRGFKPLKFRRGADEWPCVEEFCRKYPEVMYCSGFGVERCIFAFVVKREGVEPRYYEVFTVDENPRRVTAIARAKRRGDPVDAELFRMLRR